MNLRTDISPTDVAEAIESPKILSSVSPIHAARESMNGKPVIYRKAKTVLNMSSDFAHKLLSTGPALNLGDACVFSCAYCYVGPVVHKLLHNLLEVRSHEDVVVRREKPLEILKTQLAKNKQKTISHVVFSSTLVDIAANMELLRETAAACTIIFDETNWDSGPLF